MKWAVVIIVAGIVAIGSLVACCGIVGWFGQVATVARKPTPPAEIVKPFEGSETTIGDLVINMDKASVDFVQLTHANGKAMTSTEKWLVVRLVIRNVNSNKVQTITGSHVNAKLVDDLGNEYKAPNVGLSRPDGQILTTASVYSDKPTHDVLVFSRPTPGAKVLTLTMPASNFGGHGEMLFTFPCPKAD